ncbi:unnamed protein product, partial [Rotaria magnacalcarata]
EDQYASTSFASLTLSTTKNPLDLPYDRKCRQKIWNKLNQLNFSFRQKKNKTPNLREVYEFPPLVKQVIRCLYPSNIDEKDYLPKPDVIFTLDTFIEAPILFFRNTLRTQINNRAVLNKTMETGLRPMVCLAQDYFQGKIIDDLRLPKTILELPDNKTEHLPDYLPLVPGMPVLLTENLATELGLSNDIRGISYQLVYEESSVDVPFQDKNFPTNTKFIMQPKYALVEFPNCKLDSELPELQTKIVPISIGEQTFLFDVKELLAQSVAKAAKSTRKPQKFQSSIELFL